ncbi:MAG TPA: GNAT family N-acetyltransferase [Azospirillaceae bacterium]|nr:GNAT family N-acetyltransferase [Azospirillaceae bacterium]
MTVFRKLLPTESGRYRAHLLRLSPEDRRARFMGGIGDGAVGAHCARIDWSRTVLVACIERGEVRGAAELRLGAGGEAELAVSVERDWQGRGVGTGLVRRILTAARNRRARRVYMLCLPENHRMQRIAVRLMGPCVFEGGEVTSSVELAPRTPLTLVQEAIDTGAVPLGMILDQWQGDGRHAA